MTPEQFELFARIEQEHWWFVARRHIMRELILRVAPSDGATVAVDIGCGTGGNIAALADRFRCVGIDESADAIARARAMHPRVEFVRSVDRAVIAPHLARAGVVTCMDVIEHIEGDAAFLQQIVGATRPGTQLLLTVPAGMELWSEHDVTNGHFRRYTIDGFAALWSGLPVRVRLLSAFNARLYPLVWGARTLARARGRAHGAAGTDFTMPSRPMNATLRRTFAGELDALLHALDTTRRPYSRGVSVIAMLERTPD
ncbi:MAG: class I SAM-dependent methyltransferase [bacterium]